MLPFQKHTRAVVAFGLFTAIVNVSGAPQVDPCAKFAGQQFVVPADALACLKSFPFNQTLQTNVMSVLDTVFDFFTFEDWYLESPPPFQESTANIRAELARIGSTKYKVSLSRSHRISFLMLFTDRLRFQSRHI